MDYKDHKVQCEIKVIYEQYGKVFDCIQQISIKEIEDILNDKEVLVKCIDIKFINKIIKKLIEYYYVNYSEHIKHYGTIKIYFDKYILTMVNVIPAKINELIMEAPDLTFGIWMHGENVIVTENEFVNANKFVIERIVNIEEIPINGYIHSRLDGVKYNINLKNI